MSWSVESYTPCTPSSLLHAVVNAHPIIVAAAVSEKQLVDTHVGLPFWKRVLHRMLGIPRFTSPSVEVVALYVLGDEPMTAAADAAKAVNDAVNYHRPAGVLVDIRIFPGVVRRRNP